MSVVEMSRKAVDEGQGKKPRKPYPNERKSARCTECNKRLTIRPSSNPVFELAWAEVATDRKGNLIVYWCRECARNLWSDDDGLKVFPSIAC